MVWGLHILYTRTWDGFKKKQKWMRDIFEELWFIVPRTVKAVALSFPSYQQSSVNNVQNEDQHSKNRQQVLSPARTGFYNGSLSRVGDQASPVDTLLRLPFSGATGGSHWGRRGLKNKAPASEVRAAALRWSGQGKPLDRKGNESTLKRINPPSLAHTDWQVRFTSI